MDKRDSDMQGRPSRPNGEGRRLAKAPEKNASSSQRTAAGTQSKPSAQQSAARQARQSSARPEAASHAKSGQHTAKSSSQASKPGMSRTSRQSASRAQEGRPVRPESRSYIPMEDSEKYSEIRINKKMRVWNKYKNYIFAAVAVIVLVIIVVVTARSCARSGQEDESMLYSKPSMGALQVSEGASDSGTEQVTQPATQQEATVPQQISGTVLTTTKTVASEQFTAESFYANSVFVGDAIASGIDYYKYLGADRVVADTNLTAAKAEDKVSQIVSKNPERVYIMLGLNDLNYNSKTVDSIAQDFADLVAAIRQGLPNARIYVVSVTPITKACESKSNIYITMSNVEALNAKLKETMAASGAYVVDINSALQDSSGYLNSEVTGNGYNLKSQYYGFLLNTIAEMTK